MDWTNRAEKTGEFIIAISSFVLLFISYAKGLAPDFDYTVYAVGIGAAYIIARCLFKLGRGVSRKSYKTTEFKVFALQVLSAMFGLHYGLPNRNAVAIILGASAIFIVGRGYAKYLGKDIRTQLLIR